MTDIYFGNMNFNCVCVRAVYVLMLLHSFYSNYHGHISFQASIHRSAKQFASSFAYGDPTLWNELPDEVRVSPTIGIFQRKLKTYLFNKTYPP